VLADRYDLIIFDCDGVLVDSEPITARVFAGMLNEMGLQVSVTDIFKQFVGRSMDQCLAIITQWLGRPVPVSFTDDYQRRTAAALRAELKPVAGIEALLASLTLPFCVASNGTPEKIRGSLSIVGLLNRFDQTMFSVADVARGKPFPDLFLHAARTMGAAPSRCAVIEDTVTGVTAGVAAGMTVYGYSALTPARELSDAGAHHTFAAMDGLLGLLTRPVT
jgi:HAD superfamily hydrolase (TIGR01509 family)